MVAFFICGTPSNNDGFQFVDLGPGHLPGLPASYLDRAPGENVEDHRFESVFVEGRRYIQYGRVLRINPNDSAANRGAYVAVGCLIGEQLPTQSVSNCVDIVSEIFGGVCSALNRARSFPVGYRFADYVYQGAPLSDRLAHQCSPLLLTDVLRQALHNEGSFQGAGVKQLTLAPGEIIAADVERHQLYFGQGSVGSLLAADRARAQVQETVRQNATAAALLAELQSEWLSLQATITDGASEIIRKGQVLQRAVGDVERAVERDRHLHPAAENYAGRLEGGPTVDPDGGRNLEATAMGHYGPAIGARAAPFSRNRGPLARGRLQARGKRSLRSRRWAGVLAGLIGVGIAVLVVFALRQLLPSSTSTLTETTTEPTSVPSPTTLPEGEAAHDAEPPRTDVASERAALDAAPQD